MTHPVRREPRDKRLKVMARARYVGEVVSAFTHQSPNKFVVMRLRVTLPHWGGKQHIVNIDMSTFNRYCQPLRAFGDYSDLNLQDAKRFAKWIKGKKVRVLLTHHEWHAHDGVQHYWAGDLLEVVHDESV